MAISNMSNHCCSPVKQNAKIWVVLWMTKDMKQLLLAAEGHLGTRKQMIQSGWVGFFPLIMWQHVPLLAKCICVCVCVCASVDGCLCAYLAVEVRGVYTGFDDIEQWVNQALTSAHLFPGLLTSWTQVPLKTTHTHTHTTFDLGLCSTNRWAYANTQNDSCAHVCVCVCLPLECVMWALQSPYTIHNVWEVCMCVVWLKKLQYFAE